MTMHDPGDKQKQSSSPSQTTSQPQSVGSTPLVPQSGTQIGTSSPSPKRPNGKEDTEKLGLPKLATGTGVQSFGAGAGAPLVAALANVAQDKSTAEDTIAIFEYMSAHAATLSGAIARAFQTITAEQFEERNDYLMEMSAGIEPLLTKGLWHGNDRVDICLGGAAAAADYFRLGKTMLLQKAGTAHAQNKNLAALLEDQAYNMDAKTYGRRVETLKLLKIDTLPTVGGGGPQVNHAYPHGDGRLKYNTEAFVEVQPGALQVGTTYIVLFEGTPYTVTLAQNQNQTVTFATVDDY